MCWRETLEKYDFVVGYLGLFCELYISTFKTKKPIF